MKVKWGRYRQWKTHWYRCDFKAFFLDLKGQLSDDDCWLWPWRTTRRSHPAIRLYGKKTGVHRVSAWAFLGTDLSQGRSLYVCHACDTPSCFNPAHLFEGSPGRKECYEQD